MEISCVIPAFENLDLLSRCLVSALTQTGVDHEVIVVDDSETSEVRAFTAALCGRYPALRYVAGPRSGNPVDNWNRGLDQAAAPIRVLAHHDEFFLTRNYLRRAVDRLEKTGAVAVASTPAVIGLSRGSRFDMAAALARALGRPAWILPSLNWIGPTAAFVFAGAHRFDAELTWLVDVDFYRRVMATGPLERLDGVCVASLGHHPSQITARIDPAAMARADLAIMGRRGPASMARGENAFHRAVLAMRAGAGARR
ncbi:MAG: glycosyltransferase family 2 protein [Caulobacteraceae bacterium]